MAKEDDTRLDARALSGRRHRGLQARVGGSQQAAQGREPRTETHAGAPQAARAQNGRQIEPQDQEEDPHEGKSFHLPDRGKTERSGDRVPGQRLLTFELPRQLRNGILELTERDFGGIQAARDLRVEIPPRDSAGHDRDHEPISDTGQPLELERRVQSDDRWRGDSEQHMEVEPVPGLSELAQPPPLLAEWIQIQAREEEDTEHAQPQTDGSTGT
jgi:hypothetical protein